MPSVPNCRLRFQTVIEGVLTYRSAMGYLANGKLGLSFAWKGKGGRWPWPDHVPPTSQHALDPMDKTAVIADFWPTSC